MVRLVRLTVAATVLFASTSFADAAATMTVLPAAGGPPTTQVAVTIKGFAAGKSVDVYFDTTAKCVLVANAKGGGTCGFKSPTRAQPGNHWVTAVVRATGSGVQKPFLVRTDWADAHGLNAGHDGFNRFENTISPKNVHLLTALWSVLVGSVSHNSPIVYRGRLYVGAFDGKFHAFDATTGRAIAGFPKTLGEYIGYNSPVAANGIVYQAAQTGATSWKLFAFDAATGKPVIGFPKDVGSTGVLGAPVVVGGKIYALSSDGDLYGFDAKTGAVAAGFPFSIPGLPPSASTPAHSGGKLFFAADDSKVYAYDLADNYLSVRFTGAGQFGTTSPATSNGLVAILDPQDGKLQTLAASGAGTPWATAPVVGSASGGTPAIAGGQIFALSGSNGLSAFDVAAGGATWTRPLGPGNAYGSPTVANGVVLAGTDRGVFAVDAVTGAMLWQARGALEFNQSIPVVNGMVYAPGVGGSGITVYAIRGASGLAAPSVARPAISELKPDLSLKP